MRLLVVEDYKPLQKSLEKGLKEAGFAVDTTSDGQEGLWYAMSNDYDVAIEEGATIIRVGTALFGRRL